MSIPPPAHSESMASDNAPSPIPGILLTGLICLAVCALSTNLWMPWESDQMSKAAQILEIANQDDYLLSENVYGYYRLRLFPFYYSASALLYNFVGGDIFAFMNVSSVVLGVVAGISLALALQKTFGISPLWTGLTVIAMPLFVTTYSYGNEAAWSMAFFLGSLALVALKSRGWHYAGGAAVAISLFCRPDVLWLAPYWLAWVALFCKTDRDESWITRMLHPSLAFLAAALVLWVALVRHVPPFNPEFEWNWNLKLIAAYLSYPFNVSVVLLAAIGWLVLMKRNATYAWAHLLLLIPFAFYARTLASPKYIIGLLIFYGLPMAFLLHISGNRLRAAMIGLVFIWFFVGVSVFGLFGPREASLWYLPTADGPCPIGGYVSFYARAASGGYQHKQLERIAEMRDLIAFAKSATDRYWIAGHWPSNAYSLLRVWDELGTAEERARVEAIIDAPGTQDQAQPDDGSKILVLRSGYTDISTMPADLSQRVTQWLNKGQLRPHGPREALPTVIEVGDHLSEGLNSMLGKRLLFVIEHYKGHMIFEQTEFISEYRASSWLPTADTNKSGTARPIYSDAEFTAYDVPVEGGKIFSYAWPARYYVFSSPNPQRRGTLAK
jgi:hypothetical protein